MASPDIQGAPLKPAAGNGARAFRQGASTFGNHYRNVSVLVADVAIVGIITAVRSGAFFLNLLEDLVTLLLQMREACWNMFFGMSAGFVRSVSVHC